MEDKKLRHELMQEVIRHLWQQQFPGQAIPRRFDFIWERSDRKILLYTFANESPTPVFFGKSSDNKFVAERLHQEAAVLTKLKELDQYLAQTIPQPLYCSTVGHQTILFEKMIYGDPMSNFIKPYSNDTWRRETEDHFHWVTDWTIRFHQKTTEEVLLLNSKGWKEFFRECCRQFNNKWNVKIDRRKWEIIDTWLEKCDGLHLPKVIDHGDLAPHQILVTKNNYTVIDWELSPFYGLPCYDLVNFFIHYHALLRKIRRFHEKDMKDDDITSLFFSKNRHNLFLDFMRKYFVAMEIHPYFIVPILYVRYPRISLNESVCQQMVELLSVG